MTSGRRRRALILASLLVSYMAFVVFSELGGSASSWGPTVGVAIVFATLVWTTVRRLRFGRRSTELDRLIFSEATTLAFYVLMIGVITYWFIDGLTDLPSLDPTVVFTVGVLAQLVFTVVMRRRYS